MNSREIGCNYLSTHREPPRRDPGKNNAGGHPTSLPRVSLHSRRVVLIGSIFYARKLIRRNLYSRILRDAREFSSRRNTDDESARRRGFLSLVRHRSSLARTVTALCSDALYGIGVVLSKKNYERVLCASLM